MCNLAEGIYEDGIRMGMKSGQKRQLVSNIDSIMKNLSLTLENACHILEVTPEQYHKAKKQVSLSK